MRLAHTADTHLGRRSLGGGAGGVSVSRAQREQDAAMAFRRAVDGIIAAKPDAILHAGDVFETVHPSNLCALFAFQQFRRLREALPETPIIVVEGNHETPRSSQSGSPLAILGELGVRVVRRTSQDLVFPDLDLLVRAVPEAALKSDPRPSLDPPGQCANEVLLLHGEVEGVLPVHHRVLGGPLVTPADLTTGWSYVALGHYHVQHEVAPMVWYAGALEYLTTNIWGELKDEAEKGVPGKGWLLADLDARTVERQPIPMARAIHDLEPIDGAGLTAPELMAKLAAAVEAIPGGIAGTLVRLKVLDVPREISRQLDHATVRKWQASALHLRLDIQKPDRRAAGGAVDQAARKRMTLEEIVADYLGRRELPPGMDRTAFTKLGASLMTDDDYCGMPREGAA